MTWSAMVVTESEMRVGVGLKRGKGGKKININTKEQHQFWIIDVNMATLTSVFQKLVLTTIS